LGEGSLIIGYEVKLVLYTYQRLSRGRASCRYLGKYAITIISESSHTNTVSATQMPVCQSLGHVNSVFYMLAIQNSDVLLGSFITMERNCTTMA
jgi:hypothetical protein